MKVLVLTWEYPPHVVGGLGSHVSALAPALARSGVQVHVITPRFRDGAGTELSNGVHVHRADPPLWSDEMLTDVRRANVELKDVAAGLMELGQGFDLIHAHDWLVADTAAALKTRFRIPLVATFHATERGRGRGQLNGRIPVHIEDIEWRLAYEAWRVITVSRFMAAELNSHLSVPMDKIDVIPNGIDTAAFDALDGTDLAAFRARFADPAEKIVFNVGRLVREKGAHLIVEAASQVLSECPETRFLIAGMGPEFESLRSQAAALQVDRHFTFTSYITNDDRNRLYKVADCAVFPSLYEPFGIVVLEAMAARCPVIVASSGGLADLVRHHETGITVYPDSSESLAYGIVHTLNHRGWSQARAQTAYAVVRERYDWQRIADGILAIFERVVRERRSVVW